MLIKITDPNLYGSYKISPHYNVYCLPPPTTALRFATASDKLPNGQGYESFERFSRHDKYLNEN